MPLRIFIAWLLLMPLSAAYAGEAASPEEALKIIANQIEAGDFEAVSKYFPHKEMDIEVLHIIINKPQNDRKQTADFFRHAKLKNWSHVKGYEGSNGSESEYLDYTGTDGKNFSLCGDVNHNQWYVCNW